MKARKKIGVLISGRGSNLQALIDSCADPDFPAEIALVISNKPGAYGLTRAQEARLPTTVVNHKDYDSREAFDATLTARFREAGADFICEAGFNRLHSPLFVEAWPDRILNIHPSLLPSFKGLGLKVHAQALAAGVKISGCTVHIIRIEMDSGPIIGQAAVPVAPDDTPETLAARVLEAEHKLYPACVAMFAQGRVRIEGARARLLDAPTAAAPLSNPG